MLVRQRGQEPLASELAEIDLNGVGEKDQDQRDRTDCLDHRRGDPQIDRVHTVGAGGYPQCDKNEHVRQRAAFDEAGEDDDEADRAEDERELTRVE
jgi:hypothetical protein